MAPEAGVTEQIVFIGSRERVSESVVLMNPMLTSGFSMFSSSGSAPCGLAIWRSSRVLSLGVPLFLVFFFFHGNPTKNRIATFRVSDGSLSQAELVKMEAAARRLEKSGRAESRSGGATRRPY